MTDRCLARLRDENSLILSAMFRAFSKALSCSDRGSDFMFLRMRVNSVRRNRSSASFWPIEPLSPNSLPIRSALGPAWCHGQGSASGHLMAVVEDEVQLEAEEPAHLAPLGQTGECRLMR